MQTKKTVIVLLYRKISRKKYYITDIYKKPKFEELIFYNY